MNPEDNTLNSVSDTGQDNGNPEDNAQKPVRQGPVMWTFSRPALVWAFSLYFLYSTVFEVSRTYGIWAGNFGPELQSAYDGLAFVDWATMVLLTALTLTATVSFFLLRRIASTLFLTVLAVNLLSFVYQITFGSGAQAAGTSATSIVMGFGIYVLICVYSVSLRLTGVLK